MNVLTQDPLRECARHGGGGMKADPLRIGEAGGSCSKTRADGERAAPQKRSARGAERAMMLNRSAFFATPNNAANEPARGAAKQRVKRSLDHRPTANDPHRRSPLLPIFTTVLRIDRAARRGTQTSGGASRKIAVPFAAPVSPPAMPR